MNSGNNSQKLPVQTKVVFVFILILSFALVFKWMYYSILNSSKQGKENRNFSVIKLNITDICLLEESKNIGKTTDSNEDDIDWLKVKAPEYCKCVSSSLVSFWNENKQMETIEKVL